MPPTIPGQGYYEDRARFLREVELGHITARRDLGEAFSVIQTSTGAPPKWALQRRAELWSPSPVLAALEAVRSEKALREWASKFNLARDGRGEWIIEAAVATLEYWQKKSLHHQFGWPPALFPAVFINGGPTPGISGPDGNRVKYRGREKAKMGEAISYEPFTPDNHLMAIARWHAFRTPTAALAREFWGRQSDTRSVRRQLKTLQARLDLPERLVD